MGRYLGVISGLCLCLYLYQKYGGMWVFCSVIFGLTFRQTSGWLFRFFGFFLEILWSITGLIGGLIFGLIFGFHGLEIENKTIPNQGIWQSAKNTFKLSTLLFLPSTILIFSIQIILKNYNVIEALIASLMYGLVLGLLVGIPKSGTPVIKHFTLRLILYRNGYIPWNYARFLDYCTERLFLQRVGGRYRFMHKLLQDHFAEMEFKRN
ncbi:MAG: hypothetical protein V7L11_12825 [Nostoc sp.]